MIEFKTNYTGKFINITPDNKFNYDLVNQYGPWVATVSDKADVDLLIASPKMAEYMMDRAKFISTQLSSYEFFLNRHDALSRRLYLDEELERILSILKDAGVDVVKDGE